MKHAKQARALNSAETVKNQTPNVATELAEELQHFRAKWEDVAEEFQEMLEGAESDGQKVWLLSLRIDATALADDLERLATAKSAEERADAAKHIQSSKRILDGSFRVALAEANEGEDFWQRLGFLRLKSDWMVSAADAVAALLGAPVEARIEAQESADFGPFIALEGSIKKAAFLLHFLSLEVSERLRDACDGSSYVGIGALNSAADATQALERDFEAAAVAFRLAKGGAQ